MRYQLPIAACALTAASLFISQQVSADTFVPTAQASDRIIIKYKASPSLLKPTAAIVKQGLIRSSQLPVKKVKPMAGNAFVVTLDKTKQGIKSTLDETLAKLNRRSDVAYAVKDRVGYIKPLPELKQASDSKLLSHDTQWDEYMAPAGVFLESKPGLADGAWRYTMGQGALAPVVVAVLDTGIEYNDNLIDSVVKNSQTGEMFGWNFAGNDGNLSDETGGYHGSHVAGTIAGHGATVYGMGPSLRILPVKIPDASGMFYESAVINGIYWALGEDVPGAPHNPYPAKVMNMSFGIDERPGKEVDYCDAAVQEAVDFARNKGAVIVVAAGNDNAEDDYGAPAGCNGAVRVTSTGPEGLRAYYSNYGPGASYAAPGGDKRYGNRGAILSTVKSGTGYMGSGFDFYQGTSMASPHVAGLAGLVFAAGQSRNIDGTEVEKILYATTHGFGQSNDPEESCVGEKACGHGIIDANNAVKATLANYELLLTAPKLEQLQLAQSILPDTNCEGRDVAPRKLSIESPEGTWRVSPNSLVCQPASAYSLPQLSIDEHNQRIIAHYGYVAYTLKMNTSNCQLVGIDGVGCH